MRPIDADALEKDLIYKGFYPAIVKFAIRNAPTIDIEPVKHGWWIPNFNRVGYGLDGWTCSSCKGDMVIGGTNYCPNCGAKMDGQVISNI